MTLSEKGQVSAEVVIIATVLLGLLLLTSIFMTQKNIETSRLSAIQRDNETCQLISATITAFNTNKDYSEAKIMGLEKDIHIEKESIVIKQNEGGSVSCRYSGFAWLEDPPGAYTQDSGGFDLVKERFGSGMTYKVKKLDIGVVFCDDDEPSC